MSISKFVEGIAKNGGMSFSNNYDVDIFFPQTASGLVQRFSSYGINVTSGSISGRDAMPENTSDPNFILKTMCDEAQLPNVQAATGQLNGRFLGENGVFYPHSKLYSDFQLSWMCDANMTPLKFLNIWYGWIFQDYNYASGGSEIPLQNNRNKSLSELKNGAGASGGNPTLSERSVRLAYPSTYLSNIVITKTERGKNAANSRASLAYTLVDAYPYSIDAVPLSYGASQVTKVSANFYYTRHSVTFNDIRNYNG